MKRTVFIKAVVCVLIFLSAYAFAQESEPGPIQSFAIKSAEVLDTIVDAGKETVQNILSSNEPPVDKSLTEIHNLILAATERASRFAAWSEEKIDQENEKKFDQAVGEIQTYLDLISDDGMVHQAYNRVRAAALDNAREFREKAAANARLRDIYTRTSEKMVVQADRIDAIWSAIVRVRSENADMLGQLSEDKVLYLDLMKAEAIVEAVNMLEVVKNDLLALRDSMYTLQTTIASS
jgi:hypothetical protein